MLIESRLTDKDFWDPKIPENAVEIAARYGYVLNATFLEALEAYYYTIVVPAANTTQFWPRGYYHFANWKPPLERIKR